MNRESIQIVSIYTVNVINIYLSVEEEGIFFGQQPFDMVTSLKFRNK